MHFQSEVRLGIYLNRKNNIPCSNDNVKLPKSRDRTVLL